METARIPSSQAARRRPRNPGESLVVPEGALVVLAGRLIPPPLPERFCERNIYGFALRGSSIYAFNNCSREEGIS